MKRIDERIKWRKRIVKLMWFLLGIVVLAPIFGFIALESSQLYALGFVVMVTGLLGSLGSSIWLVLSVIIPLGTRIIFKARDRIAIKKPVLALALSFAIVVGGSLMMHSYLMTRSVD
ncbi:MAG: hypothetical protein K2X81_21950 [Candidatus Obscuribacterales bacterium]|nr:hypothetical protein [Candidatus Obscuribacterales bacterium]